ncbi:hypothetical protein ANN_18532 [Periplaneta americana]|uniref:Uncharacterized protein n=1 Tax=Periplaneta americana TaxID=6978 RepID=A0ABQ8SP11_PERAM|nr:hypothetical protein ANN_18532 [Periplaneta americana]
MTGLLGYLRRCINILGYSASEYNEGDNAGEMSPGPSTDSYPAFAHIELKENLGINLNQVTCPNRDSKPSHLVSLSDVVTITSKINVDLFLIDILRLATPRFNPYGRINYISFLGSPGIRYDVNTSRGAISSKKMSKCKEKEKRKENEKEGGNEKKRRRGKEKEEETKRKGRRKRREKEGGNDKKRKEEMKRKGRRNGREKE